MVLLGWIPVLALLGFVALVVIGGAILPLFGIGGEGCPDGTLSVDNYVPERDLGGLSGSYEGTDCITIDVPFPPDSLP